MKVLRVSEHPKYAWLTLDAMQSSNGVVGKDVGTNVAVIQKAIRYHPRGTYLL